jgi:hypothetical protein
MCEQMNDQEEFGTARGRDGATEVLRQAIGSYVRERSSAFAGQLTSGLPGQAPKRNIRATVDLRALAIASSQGISDPADATVIDELARRKVSAGGQYGPKRRFIPDQVPGGNHTSPEVPVVQRADTSIVEANQVATGTNANAEFGNDRIEHAKESSVGVQRTGLLAGTPMPLSVRGDTETLRDVVRDRCSSLKGISVLSDVPLLSHGCQQLSASVIAEDTSGLLARRHAVQEACGGDVRRNHLASITPLDKEFDSHRSAYNVSGLDRVAQHLRSHLALWTDQVDSHSWRPTAQGGLAFASLLEGEPRAYAKFAAGSALSSSRAEVIAQTNSLNFSEPFEDFHLTIALERAINSRTQLVSVRDDAPLTIRAPRPQLRMSGQID